MTGTLENFHVLCSFMGGDDAKLLSRRRTIYIVHYTAHDAIVNIFSKINNKI